MKTCGNGSTTDDVRCSVEPATVRVLDVTGCPVILPGLYISVTIQSFETPCFRPLSACAQLAGLFVSFTQYVVVCQY